MSLRQESAHLARVWDFVALTAGKIAHDLSNIFTSVNGFAELAASQVKGQTAAEAYLAEVQQAGTRGVVFADRLHLLKHCTSRPTFHSSVGAAVESAVSAVRASLSKVPKIHCHLQETLPPVRISPDALRTILLEVVRNGCEAAGEAGDVHITAETINLEEAATVDLLGRADAGPHVCLTVEDTGPGLPAELMTKFLSVPFFTTKLGPRGIGLPIVFRTVYAYQGGFTLRNRSTGGGEVKIWLPAGE